MSLNLKLKKQNKKNQNKQTTPPSAPHKNNKASTPLKGIFPLLGSFDQQISEAL